MATKTLVTRFRHADEAESAAYNLLRDGFPVEAVGWVTRAQGGREIAHGNLVQQQLRSRSGRANIGSVVGGVLGLLIGITALAIAGIRGAVLVVASLVFAFVGVAFGAAADRRIDTRVRVEVPREQAHRYAATLRTDAAVVTVTVTDERQEARALEILRDEANQHMHPLVWRIPARSDEGRPSKPSLA